MKSVDIKYLCVCMCIVRFQNKKENMNFQMSTLISEASNRLAFQVIYSVESIMNDDILYMLSSDYLVNIF